MSQVLEEEIPGHEIGVLSGPNLAKEISEKQLTGTVIASRSEQLCDLVQEVMGNSYFRVYSNDDRTGVELAGTLKNIYAILSGIAFGMGFGANSMAMLLTRSLTEMSRYAAAQGANAASYLGLSGVGDLFATCTSPLSRNFQIGLRVGKGMSLKDAFDDLGQTAEGVNTVAVVHERAEQLDISMPLCRGLYEILHENRPVKEVVSSLMDRDQKQDVEYRVN
jgi:glycerol-3-phosphate dehydrogenase (NAD(P)+)